MAVFNAETLEFQKDTIKSLLKTQLSLNDVWYLIDNKWFKQWQTYVNYESINNNLIDQSAYPGPIDNSNILKGDSNDLKEQLYEDTDFVFVPEKAWEYFVEWYSLSDGQEPIPRKVISQGVFNKSYKIELYLLEVKFCKYDNLNHQKVKQFSQTTPIEQVEKEVKKLFDIPENQEIRLWLKHMNNAVEPIQKDTILKEASIFNESVVIIEDRDHNGTWPYQSKISRMAIPYEGSSKTHFQPGLCGLSNLGNTCFMNSAIQCMSNVPPLTDYMLANLWRAELNAENPLGMRGEIASTYAELITNMWSGRHNCTAPRQFKIAVGRFKPEFSGYQQQDSQELMAFLLDGLHEDLNRIRKKPYIETKEADNRPDAEVASETWQDYVKRNDSIIVDTFHGLLKSTLVCPECQKVSIKFDPFCYLSLPLPVKKDRQINVLFVAHDPAVRTKQLKVTVPKAGVISDLCLAVSQIVHCNFDQMIVTDVYNHRFHKIFSMNDQLSAITDKDDIFVYHVPSVDQKTSDQATIPVYVREVNAKTITSCGSQAKMFGMPFFISVQRNCTYDEVYNKILERMSRYVRDCNGLASKAPSTFIQSDDESEESEKIDDDCNDDSEMLGYGCVDPPSQLRAASSSDRMEVNNSIENTSSDVDKDIENNNNNINPQLPARLFSLRLVNSYGSADFEKLNADKGPLKLPAHAYIAADWMTSMRRKFFDDKEAEAVDIDPCLENRPVTKKTILLSDCLELFTTMEKLGEQDPWYCPSCKKHQQATKKFDLWKLPQILVIHLKRFSYNRFWRDKLDTYIEYPTEGLDMSKFIINKDHAPATYDLIAVSNHYGGLGGGHYTACAKNKNLNRWFYFDDSSVSPCEENNVVTKAGYVLVYQARTASSNNSGSGSCDSCSEPSSDNGLPPPYDNIMEM